LVYCLPKANQAPLQHDVAGNDDDESARIAVLANSALTRFYQLTQISSLDRAAALHNDALLLLDATHVKRFASLNSLATTLVLRFHQGRQLPDLEKAISLYCEARVLVPGSPLDLPVLLNNLSAALLARFCVTAQFVDLRNAVESQIKVCLTMYEMIL
jgi:hypothetical protein